MLVARGRSALSPEPEPQLCRLPSEAVERPDLTSLAAPQTSASFDKYGQPHAPLSQSSPLGRASQSKQGLKEFCQPETHSRARLPKTVQKLGTSHSGLRDLDTQLV